MPAKSRRKSEPQGPKLLSEIVPDILEAALRKASNNPALDPEARKMARRFLEGDKPTAERGSK